MLARFIKYTWKPYLVSLLLGSLMVAIVLSFPSGNIEVFDIISFTFIILCLAVPVTLILAIPVAFLIWSQLQQRKISLSHLQASLIGFIAGSILYTVFLISFNGLNVLPDLFLFACLCGGVYGLIYALMFSLSGGLVLFNYKQYQTNEMSNEVTDSDGK